MLPLYENIKMKLYNVSYIVLTSETLKKKVYYLWGKKYCKKYFKIFIMDASISFIHD